MIINHNLSAMFTQRQAGLIDRGMRGDFEKLSSGYRINRAGDDAAGLAVSEKMRSQIRGLQQASRNAQDGISFIQTVEGSLTTTSEALQRIRELAVQASNGVYTSEDRMQLQVEVSQLIDEIDRVASTAQFNGLTFLTGRFSGNEGDLGMDEKMFIHLGANMDQREDLIIGTMTATALGIKTADGNILSLSTTDKSNILIGFVDIALRKVNRQRADLGAYQNRLENAMKFIDSSAENLQSSESLIRDANIAKISVDLSKNQILMQTSMAMLAQANQKGQTVLGLLR